MYNGILSDIAYKRLKAISEYLGIKYTKPNDLTYIVKPNDSLYKIASKYNTTITQIIEKNNLTTNTIYPGAVLKI